MWTSGEDNAVTRGRVGVTGLWGGAEARTDHTEFPEAQSSYRINWC